MTHLFSFYRVLRSTPVSFFISICSFFLFAACGSSRDAIPVAELKQNDWKETITLSEFERRYTENNRTIEKAKTDSISQYKEFLDRFIDFRLKVKDARDAGLDKKPEVLAELEQYKLSMAPAYLTEKEVMESAIQTLYKRRQEEVNASHILIRAAQNSSPADTLKAYNELLNIKADILAKKISFDSAAVQFSQDPSASQNKGNLGYFTAGMMVHQFEDATFDGKIGDLIGPVRTRFGYHLINIVDRRTRNQIFVSHIMAFCTPESMPNDTLAAYNKIIDAQSRLNQGEPFSEVARNLSDDRQSAANGGELGAIGKGQIPAPEFDIAAFNLTTIGELSPIIRTRFGYHIIQLNYKGFKPLESERETLKSLLQRNPEKMNAEDDKLYARLKKDYLYVETLANAEVLSTKADSGKTFSEIDSIVLSPKEKSAPIFSFANQTYTLDSLISYIKANNVGLPVSPASVLDQVKAYSKDALKRYEVSQLELRYPEFAQLMSDYRDGILLFNISEEKVWSKALPNDSVARPYYEAHRSRYNFNDRVGVSQIVLSNKPTADKIYEELTTGKRTLDVVSLKDVKKQTAEIKKELSRLKKRDKNYQVQRNELNAKLASLKVDEGVRAFEQLSKRYGQKFGDDDTLKTGSLGLFQKGENKSADQVFDKPIGFICSPTQLDGAFVIIRVDSKEAPRPKNFDEARPEVFSQFQEETTKRLETEWISNLRTKTEVKIYDDNLLKAFQFVEPASSDKKDLNANAKGDFNN